MRYMAPARGHGHAGYTSELYRWENAHLRRMLRIRRKPVEDFAKHIERATRSARKLLHGKDNLGIVTRSLDRLHRIACASSAKLCLCSSWGVSGDLDNYGSLVDTTDTPTVTVQVPSQCFLPAYSLWWDWQSRRRQQALGAILHPEQVTVQWRHTRMGCHTVSETVFSKVFGED